MEGILGIRPDLTGITIEPSIPKSWEHLEIQKDFRGKRLHITIQNPDKRESGVKTLVLNGRELEGSHIPASLLLEENEIILTL